MADQTESEIQIAGSPGQIMDVIADLERYPEWSEGITAVEVLAEFSETGRPAEARFTLHSGPLLDTYELEYSWDGDDRVSWWLTTGTVLKAMDGTYALRDNGDGTTAVSYRLAVDVKIPLIGVLKRRAEKVIVDTALKGLKARVES